MTSKTHLGLLLLVTVPACGEPSGTGEYSAQSERPLRTFEKITWGTSQRDYLNVDGIVLEANIDFASSSIDVDIRPDNVAVAPALAALESEGDIQLPFHPVDVQWSSEDSLDVLGYDSRTGETLVETWRLASARGELKAGDRVVAPGFVHAYERMRFDVSDEGWMHWFCPHPNEPDRYFAGTTARGTVFSLDLRSGVHEISASPRPGEGLHAPALAQLEFNAGVAEQKRVGGRLKLSIIRSVLGSPSRRASNWVRMMACMVGPTLPLRT